MLYKGVELFFSRTMAIITIVSKFIYKKTNLLKHQPLLASALKILLKCHDG